MTDKNTVTVDELGVKLASSLQVHSEACRKARRRLPKLVSLVNSTALTLRQIRELIEQNQDVYKQACLSDIDSLTVKCRKIYEGILILMARRTQSVSGDEDITDMPVEKVDELLSCLANMSVWRTKSWNWLEPRFKICEQELKQIKFELVLRYLLGSIAQLQMQTLTRSPGAWENENSMRCFAENVSARRAKYYKYFEKNRAALNVAPSLTSSASSSRASLDDVRSTSSRATTTTAAASTPGSEDKGSAPTDVAEFLLGKDPEKVHHEEIGAGDQGEPVEVVDLKESNVSTQAPKPHQPSQMFLGAARAWFQRIVSPSTANDWNDQNIEAFQFDITSHCYGNPEKSVVKLAMDAEQLKTVLSKLNSHRRWRRSPELIEQYTSLDPRVRLAVDSAITTARHWSHHERSLVGMMIKNSTKGPGLGYEPDFSVTLFLRLGNEVQPVHILDPCGRKLTLPWSCCLSIKMTQDALALNNYWIWPVNTKDVTERRYSFRTEDDVSIIPDAWRSLVRPGVTLRMVMWHAPIPPMGHHAPPPHWAAGIGPKVVQVDPEKKKVYHEMVELLGFEDAWSPDKETMKPGLRNLLSLWTNAVDPHAEDCSDSDSSASVWSSSSSSSTSSWEIAD